jgi:ethanolamine-phosphate cytidylyltransferase
MLQSRRLGDELFVGLHNDEDIAANKGPTVMNLAERTAAVNACRFSTKCIPHAPYVTSIPWITHYGCQYVSHGDDITSDASGEDCYRFVKRAGRMKIVPRTPGISTTDLVGRMLAQTKDHHIASLVDCIAGKERSESAAEGAEMKVRIEEYAAAPNGTDSFVDIHTFDAPSTKFTPLVSGRLPRPGQRLIYVDGGFDLFSSGHISFLQTVSSMEEKLGHSRDWYTPAAKQRRISETGSDYPPAYIIAGVHDDATVNSHRGANYPIMNIFERGLCVVQCTYIHAVVFNAPYVPSKSYLSTLPFRQDSATPDAVYHGPTAFMPPSAKEGDPYADAHTLGIFQETSAHDFQDVNSEQIVGRILGKRAEYEERQRKKGAKVVGEEEAWRREKEGQQA